MFEDIQQHRAAVAENIQKAVEIGFTGNELEKAHKVGDIHPNGKWVWTQLPSGKYDWRVIKKTSAGSGAAAPAAAQKPAQSGKGEGVSISANHPSLASVPGVQNIKDALTTYNSKYTDLSKVELIKTPKGNWDLHYDGHRLGIIAGSSISDRNAAKMGWVREGTDDLTRSKRDAEEEKKQVEEEAKKKQAVGPTDSEICAMSFDEAKKLGKVDVAKVNAYNVPTNLRGCKRDLENLRGKGGLRGTMGEIEYAERDLLNALKSEVGGKGWNSVESEAEKAKKIRDASDELATKEELAKRVSKVQSDLNKMKKNFLDSTGKDFTEKEIQEWLEKYNTADEPAAVVQNTWNYYMGRIGSTSATIRVGSGKEKPFDTSRWGGTVPSWRPIGIMSYSIKIYGYGNQPSTYEKIEIPIQSWNDVQKHLSDTESYSISLYKHPKQ